MIEIREVIGWCFCIMIVPYLICLYREKTGGNAAPGQILADIVEAFKKTPLNQWGKKYKENMKKLSKTGFVKFKMRGVVPTKKSQLKASRGYDKLKDVLIQTRIHPQGRILSVCCGRGGWEQLIAQLPLVSRITSVTLGKGPGHEGHEDFTEKYFPGKEKVELHYGDARVYPVTEHEVLLFDGGEAHKDSEVEARRFNNLLDLAVVRQLTEKTQDFVIKILTPWDKATLELMKKIQKITGKGSLVRSVHSRASTLEVYLVSGPAQNLDQACRNILIHSLGRGLINPVLAPRSYQVGYDFAREKIDPFAEELKPLDLSDSIKELGPSLPEERRNFVHWESLGIYAWGVTGSASTRFNKYTYEVVRTLLDKMTGLMGWRATDTTPAGFMGVFNKKVDKSPVENHQYRDMIKATYEALACHFRSKGFRYHELAEEDLLTQLNKQGAATRQDIGYKNIGEFLQIPSWRDILGRVKRSLLIGKPVCGIFTTMGKREKKYNMVNQSKGSRMVAYLPIPMRILEMKVFGCLMDLTKKELNRFGVGGLGLHDLGMRLAEVWKGCGLSSDIAGFDTRVSLFLLSMENMFIRMLGGSNVCTQLYRLYAYPHILIPVPDREYVRSELVAGRGQRMSGTAVTYAMNTITRIVVLLMEHAVTCGVTDMHKFTREVMKGGKCCKCQEPIEGVVSGDDATQTSTKRGCEITSTSGKFLSEIGMPIKDLPKGTNTPIARSIEEVDFCSHHYEKVSYYDGYNDTVQHRWMPTRDVAEIVGKSTIRVSGVMSDLSDEAWMSAQGSQLLVMYHHLRTVRILGLCYKAMADPCIILTDKGGELRPTPWMQPGDVLEVINTVLFGDSTAYPSPGFRVREFGHLGYMPRKRESNYDPDIDTRSRVQWRRRLPVTVAEAVNKYALKGRLSILSLWRDIGLE